MEVDQTIGGVCGYMGLILSPIMDNESKKRKDEEIYNQIDSFTQILIDIFDI